LLFGTNVNQKTGVQKWRMAGGHLALPEVAIDVELASSLVDQTVGLTKTMVRRRVDQKFYTLRLRVTNDCLAPFVKMPCKKKVSYQSFKWPVYV
jgi:hypothetical protein